LWPGRTIPARHATSAEGLLPGGRDSNVMDGTIRNYILYVYIVFLFLSFQKRMKMFFGKEVSPSL